ncbi:hypothetical protein GCM10027062_21280 [Nocardioides hungaricus]
MSDDVDLLLRELARDLRVPTPDPGLADAVVARVAVARRSHRLRWAVVAAIAAALLGLTVSPVGAKVAGWLDFGGVMVRDDDSVPSGTPVVASEPAASLDGAAFDPLVPAELGPPDGVSVGDDGTLVSMSWTVAGRTVRLDQFAADLDPYFWKSSPVVERVDVAGRDALWFPVPHEVVVVPEGGAPMTEAPRLTGQTLVVQWNGVTLRLEGSFGLDRAVAIIASLE